VDCNIFLTDDEMTHPEDATGDKVINQFGYSLQELRDKGFDKPVSLSPSVCLITATSMSFLFTLSRGTV
jgi:hypothetical protein